MFQATVHSGGYVSVEATSFIDFEKCFNLFFFFGYKVTELRLEYYVCKLLMKRCYPTAVATYIVYDVTYIEIK